MMRTILIRLFLISTLSLLLSCPGGGTGTPPSDPNIGLYHNYAEIDAGLHALAAAHPDIAQISTIGKSLENRDLWAIKISDNVDQDEDEATVILLGTHHAREWIAADVPYLIAKHMIENYATDPAISTLIDNAEVWVVPMVNPDGHQYSITNNRLWRKNRRNNGDGTFGVDLNRNYGYNWGGPGSSGDSFSDTYRGPSAFSEPETQAVRDFVQREAPTALISYHNFSQLILYPWGSTYAAPPDEALLSDLARALRDKIQVVHNATYVPQQASDLYLASGDTIDWLYGVLSTVGFTIELRPRSSFPGFELPESEIQPTFEENLPAALHLIDWAIQRHSTTSS